MVCAEHLAERPFAHFDYPLEVAQRLKLLHTDFLFVAERHVDTVIIRGFCGDAIRRVVGDGAAQLEAKILRLAGNILG
jgi:hypothetical protein